MKDLEILWSWVLQESKILEKISKGIGEEKEKNIWGGGGKDSKVPIHSKTDDFPLIHMFPSPIVTEFLAGHIIFYNKGNS